MTEIEAGFLAMRLLSVSALVLLVPGLAFLSAMRIPVEWPERIVVAFSLSYSWIFVSSVFVPLFGWTVDRAALAMAILVAGLIGAIVRRRWRRGTMISVGRPAFTTLAVIAVVIAAGVAAWVIESPFTGEEALDLASLSRFADGGRITFESTSLLPDTRPVYLFQPYQLALGMIARWSGTDPLVAFVKFRTFLAPLCLVCIYALSRRVTETRAEAIAVFIVVVLGVALEIETWERNSLFPFVRRQGFSAGVLVPSLLVLYILATRRVQKDDDRLLRRVALGVVPLMLVASLSTHAVEVVTFLCFVAAATTAIVAGLDRSGDRKRAVVVVSALAMATGAYLTAHSQAVPYIAERGSSRRLVLGEELDRLVTKDGQAFAWASVERDNIFVGSSPLTTAAVIGIPALGLAALRMPAAAAVLALGTVPLALLWANPSGSILLRWAVAPGTMRDTTPYFMLIGIVGVALGLVALAEAILNAAGPHPRRYRYWVIVACALSLVVTVGREVVLWLGELCLHTAPAIPARPSRDRRRRADDRRDTLSSDSRARTLPLWRRDPDNLSRHSAGNSWTRLRRRVLKGGQRFGVHPARGCTCSPIDIGLAGVLRGTDTVHQPFATGPPSRGRRTSTPASSTASAARTPELQLRARRAGGCVLHQP